MILIDGFAGPINEQPRSAANMLTLGTGGWGKRIVPLSHILLILA